MEIAERFIRSAIFSIWRKIEKKIKTRKQKRGSRFGCPLSALKNEKESPSIALGDLKIKGR